MSKSAYFQGEPVNSSTIDLLVAEVGMTASVCLEIVALIEAEEPWELADYPEELHPKLRKLTELVELKEPLLARPPSNSKEASLAIVGTLTESMGGHFLITDDMQIRLNPENLPTIGESYKAVAGVVSFKEVTTRAENYSNWLLGELIIACRNHFGEDFNVSQVCEETSKSYHTCYDAEVTVERFGKNKRPGLDFSHHKEVACANIPDDEKDFVIDMASRLELTTRDIRDVVRYVKRGHGIDTLKKVGNTEDLSAKLKEGQDEKADYLVCNDQNLWTKIRGIKKEAPTGKTVINITDMTVTIDGKTESIATT